MQRRLAGGAVLRVEFADELVEAGFVGHVRARKLQYSLALEGVFERLLADSALASDKCSFPSKAASVRVGSHSVVVDGSYSVWAATSSN